MLRVILIDDEQRALNVLENLLNRVTIPIEVVACCRDLKEGVAQIKSLKPDVVFLDVQMPNYAGYEIVNFFDTIDFEIVFVTAYDRFALKAFEINAIDYLLKPVSRLILSEKIERISKIISQKKVVVDYQNLLDTINKKEYTKLVIPESGDRKVINLENIVAIEANGSYSVVHLKNNKNIITSKNLKYFENVLLEKSSFYRSHRAWIINLDYIETLNKTELSVTLANRQVIAKISRRRLSDFESVFNS